MEFLSKYYCLIHECAIMIYRIKMTLRFSLLLVSTLVLFGCYDYEPRVEQVYQEVMDWGSFKKGSWWVYQEDSSKLLDTILVFHHEIVANDFMYDFEYGVNRTIVGFML